MKPRREATAARGARAQHARRQHRRDGAVARGDGSVRRESEAQAAAAAAAIKRGTSRRRHARIERSTSGRSISCDGAEVRGDGGLRRESEARAAATAKTMEPRHEATAACGARAKHERRQHQPRWSRGARRRRRARRQPSISGVDEAHRVALRHEGDEGVRGGSQARKAATKRTALHRGTRVAAACEAAAKHKQRRQRSPRCTEAQGQRRRVRRQPSTASGDWAHRMARRHEGDGGVRGDN